MGIQGVGSTRGSFFEKRQKKTTHIKDGGVTHAYRADPTVLRGMREIDPRLKIEWRPKARWWTGWGMSTRPPEAELGGWRLLVQGESGSDRGLKLLPPTWGTSANCGELVAYLKAHWLPKIKQWRDYHQSLSMFNEEVAERQTRERRRQAWESIDHNEMWRASRTAWESPGWRSNWNVAGSIR